MLSKISNIFTNNFVVSISEISLAGLFVGLWVLSSKFISFDLGIMNVGITYIWNIAIGLLFRPFIGIVSAVLADTISLAISKWGIGQWNWVYAIIPILIYFITYFFKKIFQLKSQKQWYFFINFFVILMIALSFVLSILNFSGDNNDHWNFFIKNAGWKNTFINQISKIMIFVMLFLIIIVYFILFWLYHQNKSLKIKNILNIYALTSFVTIFVIWFWGPIANIIFLNKISSKNYWSNYHLFLIFRILKTPFIFPIYTLLIFYIYSAISSIKKFNICSQKW